MFDDSQRTWWIGKVTPNTCRKEEPNMTDQPQLASRARLMQIGELADSVGLSLRTIRYYEDVGLVPPVERTAGGFRLYDAEAVERLLIIKAMKPLGFQLDEMRELIDALRRIARDEEKGDASPADREVVRDYYPKVEHEIDKAFVNLLAARRLANELRENGALEPAPEPGPDADEQRPDE